MNKVEHLATVIVKFTFLLEEKNFNSDKSSGLPSMFEMTWSQFNQLGGKKKGLLLVEDLELEYPDIRGVITEGDIYDAFVEEVKTSK